MNPETFVGEFKQANANRWVTFAVGFKFPEPDLPLSDDRKRKLHALLEQQILACGQVLRQEIQSPNAERTLVIDLPEAVTVNLFGIH
jgi:hypothetical protein